MEAKRKSIFMQMHDGERQSEGSFNIGLQKLFYLAGTGNKRKLVEAFPEFFSEEVPEFGIVKKAVADKTFKYNGWLCKWDAKQMLYFLYSPAEMEQPAGFREYDTECGSVLQCKAHIDSF